MSQAIHLHSTMLSPMHYFATFASLKILRKEMRLKINIVMVLASMDTFNTKLRILDDKLLFNCILENW